MEKQLSRGRVFLFEDHVHACVACRHALERARDGEKPTVWRVEAERSRSFGWRWAMGATAVLAGAMVAVLAFNNGLLPGQHMVRASVQTVDGSLYTGSGAEIRVIPVGYQIRNGDEVRTAKGSRAVVRLLDGSLWRWASALIHSVSRAWQGNTATIRQPGWWSGHRSGSQAAFGPPLRGDRRRTRFGERHNLSPSITGPRALAWQ